MMKIYTVCSEEFPQARWPCRRVEQMSAKSIIGIKKMAFNRCRFHAKWIQISYDDECIAFREVIDGRWHQWDSLEAHSVGRFSS